MEKQMHFSYDLEATLTDEERIADQILSKLKSKELKNDNYNTVIHDYFTNFVSILPAPLVTVKHLSDYLLG